MNLDNVYIFDIEADGLLDTVTKIHVLSVGKVNRKGELKIKSITDYEEMKIFFMDKDITKVGHNIIRYDYLVVEKILGITPATKNTIDTLPISWYAFPDLLKHGLEEWGEMLGVEKPHIEDWQNQTIEDYTHRCQEDVKINHLLWLEELSYLRELYDNDNEVLHCIKYLIFKTICVRDQEKVGVRFDRELCEITLADIEREKEEKIEQLRAAMPKVEVVSKKKRPKVYHTKKGQLSANGKKWEEFCKDYGVPIDMEEVSYISGYAEPNPQSTAQLKAWLESHNWIPDTYTYTRNKETNEFKKIPQIFNKDTGEVTDSVKLLMEVEPALKALDNLGKLKHRAGILSGFLRDAIQQEDGTWRIYPSMSGYTSTLRLQHKIVVNLPKVGVYLGESIRGCLIADEGHILCGADLSNIENKTRDAYIYNFDSAYVETMNTPGYDSHLELAQISGYITEDEVLFYKWYNSQKH